MAKRKPNHPYGVKTQHIPKLANKALKDKPKWKPPKGYVYLKDVEVGSVVRIPNIQMEAIKIAESEGQTTVIVTECPETSGLGKRFWANKTEVQKGKLK